MENKRCRCRLFSCFSCFYDENTTPSATQPDHSSEIAPPYHSSAVPSTAAPNATDHGPQLIVPPDASSSSTDVLPESNEIAPVDHFSVKSTAAPNATDDALKHPQHGPQPILPPDASSSSTNVLPDSNEPQPIVHPDLSSSSPLAFPAHDEVYQVSEAGSSSNAATDNHRVADDQLQGTPSSSSVSNAPHLINSILTAANALDTENVDADLDGLIEYISNLLERIKEKKITGKKSSKTQSAKDYWQSRSGNLRKIREILSDGINVFKDILPGETKTAIQGLLKGMGMAHLACTGLLVVALVLERFDTTSTNKEECLCVLDEICKLTHHVNDIKQRPGLRGAMDASIKEAINLIVEASIMCSTQIGSSNGRRFFSASGNKEDLVKFQQKLQRMYRHMDKKMGICLYDATECRQVRPQKPRERPYPEYAVGIEKPVEELKELLEWESEKNAVAVIVHGFGGIGKTTVADAVFARLHVEGCKYSMVRLFEDVTLKPSPSDIVKLQTYILKDLKMGTPEETTSEEIRTPEEGQREIERILEKEKAFIYVDNALERYSFEQLLPKDISKAKKLRLLITTRDRDVGRECSKLKPKIYPMKVLPHIEAKFLLEKELYGETDNMEKPLSSSQLDQMVEMCGCIPKLLIVVAGFISCEDNQQEAYGRVKEERERNWKGEIGKDIAHYVFAYQKLDETLKDPFLDICSFFNGWEWSEVADRLGDGELNSLEKRALVTKTKWRTVSVHDVILAMGLQQAEGTRFRSANKLQEFLDEKEDKEIRKIKGIMLPFKDRVMRFKDPLYISASKLDLMCTSLRLFELDLAKVKGKCEKIFEKLLYFKGQILDLPFDVSRSKELKYLDLSYPSYQANRDQEFSNYEELLGSISKLGYLRVLKLSCCKNLRQLTKDFGSLNSLQKLHLKYCRSLEALPSSLGNLSSLKLLDLWGCKSLKDLPCDLGKLTSLAQLRLDDCSELSSIPDSIGQLRSLARLGLSGCRELSSIPDSIGQLKSLHSSINLSRTGLKELPDGFCNLSFITHLSMYSCERLKKLPETFGQLKYLKQLDLSWCTILEELCRNFNGLSSLRRLSLNSCKMLKKLPEDFHCLASLEVLSLRDCHMLEGKWMESMVEMKTLQVVDITGSPMLEERWEEIEREGDPSCSFGVQGSSNKLSKERIFKQLHSKFDSILTNCRVSDLPINTLLLFMFDDHKEFYYRFPSLIEENIDDIQTNFQMIYVGNHFNKLPKKIADRILGHAPANSNAKALFQKVSATIRAHPYWLRSIFEMGAKIVSDKKGDKYLSCWELLSEQSVEEFVIKNCGRYLKLKEVVEKRGGGSNIELLRELFATSGEDTFLRNGPAGKVRVEDLEGKTILLDIRPAKRSHDIIPLQPLMEMYLTEKDRLNFEIITIPTRGEWDVFEQFSRQVPWLLLHNPRQLKTSVIFFLVEGCLEKWRREYDRPKLRKLVAWDRWHLGTMRVIEINGTIAAYNRGVLRMVNTWGAKAYPFTEEKNKELKGEERKQMKAMSNLMFLFKDLESLWDQVKEVKGKMICLYTSQAEAGVAGSIRDMLIELRDNIHIIYIPQYFKSRHPKVVHYTYGIAAIECVPGEGKMAEIEMMEGMSLLSEEEATRYWARMYSLKEYINEMDDNDKQLDGIKQLLYFIHHGYPFYTSIFDRERYSWMGIIDEDGELVTTVGKESIEKAKDKTKELIQQLVKCPKECRKQILVELEQLQV